MLLRSDDSLLSSIRAFIEDSKGLHIFCPYVKLDSIKRLLEGRPCKALIVRWELSDLVSGASDLAVYEFCKANNMALYRNPDLHLKAYLSDDDLLITTANISTRGLGIPEAAKVNYEVGCRLNRLSLSDRLFFRKIINESALITDSVYDMLVKMVNDLPEFSPISLAEPIFPYGPVDKNFLISALPMTVNPKTLTRICETGEALNDVELNCAMHDLALYNIPLGLPPDVLKERLKRAFFGHPFVLSFLENLEANGEIFFGAAKAWIQRNCADVPTPRRWEITTNIQILYRWIVDLSDGRYQVDQPNISERLFLVK